MKNLFVVLYKRNGDIYVKRRICKGGYNSGIWNNA